MRNSGVPDSYVSNVLASSKGDIVALNIYDTSSELQRLQAWNWRTSEMVAEFDTISDGFGRIAISSNGAVLFAGSWENGEKGGVAAYDIRSGDVLWHRDDISKTQSLHYSQSVDAVWCSTDDGPVQSLDGRTGETLVAWETVQDAFDSGYSTRWLAERKSDYVLVGDPSIAIPRVTSSLCQAVFSPEAVCLSEARGPVRCLETNTGDELWRYSPEQGHVTQLSYQPDGFLYGVLFLSHESQDSKLVRFALNTGASEVLYHQAERNPYAWSIGPGVLITRSGEVVSLQTGNVLRQLTICLGK